MAAQGALKLRKSNLLGIVTWDEMSAQFDVNNQHDFDVCCETITKMLRNIIDQVASFHTISTSYQQRCA